jgi:hypothetical protein
MKNTNEQLQRLLELVDYLLGFTSGAKGFDRVANGNTTNNDKEYFAIKAINGDVTLGSGTTVNVGDGPSSGDVLQQGDVLYGSFDNIEVTTSTSGDAYAYYRNV